MKIKRHITIPGVLCAALLFCACNDWLDVKSDTDIIGKDLFSKNTGFHTAVNGTYRLIADRSLYSRDLNYGMLSVLGNNYTEARLPAVYAKLAQGLYGDKDCQKIVDPVWEKAYEAIANCNNIIQQAEAKSDDFFSGGKVEKDMIIGEMTGLRAMLHLDMLRLFAPIPSLAGNATYIPYVDVYPSKQPQHLTVAKTLEYIIRDLAEAKNLLKYLDSEYNPWAIQTYSARMGGGTSTQSPLAGEFFTTRGTRMNYFAATALLARAYQWNGQAKEAYDQAWEIFDFNRTNGWYGFEVSATGRKMSDDILLASYNEKIYDILSATLESQKNFCYKNEDVLFAANGDDYRLTRLIQLDPVLQLNLSVRWQRPEGQIILSTEDPLAPVVRMSEALYIVCEYLIGNGKKGEALGYLNAFRFDRGVKSSIPEETTAADLLEILYNDMTREFMSEGQAFFLYKRLNRPIFNGNIPQDMTDRYVLPIPYSENAYL